MYNLSKFQGFMYQIDERHLVYTMEGLTTNLNIWGCLYLRPNSQLQSGALSALRFCQIVSSSTGIQACQRW